MKKLPYMVIITYEDGQFAHFFKTAKAAEQYRMDACVSLGYDAEVYELMKVDDNPDPEYVFSYS